MSSRGPSKSVPEVFFVQDAREVPEMEPQGVSPVLPGMGSRGIDFHVGDSFFLARFAEAARGAVEAVVVAAGDEHQLAGILGPGDAVDGISYSLMRFLFEEYRISC